MFKRKILEEMNSWKESLKIKKRALVIKGLRQIGKTTIVNEYAKANYKSVIYINFLNNNSLKQIFDDDIDLNRIIRNISAFIPNCNFIANDTVIIFDELQECPNARTSIKEFMLDGRFDIIATGSLLGLRGYNKGKLKGIPTGFEYIVQMYPMDFEEYLWAKGINQNTIDYIKECFVRKEKIDTPINNVFMDHFKEYLCVGGMPDSINTFLQTHNMDKVLKIQQSILEQYKDDFGKHLNEDGNISYDNNELVKIMEIYNSIPNQLAKENKKFQYSNVSEIASARKYRNAITWLEEFGLVKICYNLSTLEFPLEGNKIDSQFKLYVADTGLFCAMLGKGVAGNILNNDLKIFKGAIYENIVAEAFGKINKNLYYYSKSSGLEIDFVTTFNNQITLVEVKSTNNKAKSLSTVMKNNTFLKAIKLIDGNIGDINNIYSIPLYMAFLID